MKPVDSMDHDVAWDQFKKESTERVQKTSIAGKLDTIAAQLNEIQTDTSRVAELAPKILGDESAVDEANQAAPDMGGSGGDMGDALGSLLGGGESQEEPAPEESPEEMPPAGGESMGADMGGEPPAEAPAEPESEPPIPEPGPEDEEAAGGLSEPEEPVSPEEAEPEVPMEEEPLPDEGDEDPEVNMAFEDLVTVLQEQIEAAEDMEDYERADRLSALLDRLIDSWDMDRGGNEYPSDETFDETEGTGDEMDDDLDIDVNDVSKSDCAKADDVVDDDGADVVKASIEESGTDGADSDVDELFNAPTKDAEKAAGSPDKSEEGAEGDAVPRASKTTETDGANPIENSETPADSPVDEMSKNLATETMESRPGPGEEIVPVEGGESESSDDSDDDIDDDTSDEPEEPEEKPNENPFKKGMSFRERMEFMKSQGSLPVDAYEGYFVKSEPKTETAPVVSSTEEEYVAVNKAEPQGKHLTSMRELMQNEFLRKSGRPNAPSELVNPGDEIQKAAGHIKWGPGVDPKKVMEADWKAYNLYKSRKEL